MTLAMVAYEVLAVGFVLAVGWYEYRRLVRKLDAEHAETMRRLEQQLQQARAEARAEAGRPAAPAPAGA